MLSVCSPFAIAEGLLFYFIGTVTSSSEKASKRKINQDFDAS